MRRSLVVPVAVLLTAAALSTACGSTGTGRGASAPAQASEQLDFGVDMARRGLWSEALFRFHQAEKLEPGNPRIQNNLAVAYEATGEFEQALQHYQSALKLDPNNRDLRANWTRFSQFYSAFTSQKRVQGQTDQPRPAAPSTTGGQQPEIPGPGSIRPQPVPLQQPPSDPSSPPTDPASPPVPL